MKKTLLSLLMLCCITAAFSQDLIEKIQALTLVNDSLQKQVIKPLNDSIAKLNAVHSAELNLLKTQVDSLKQEKFALNNKVKILESEISDLNKTKIKAERDRYKKMLDSINARTIALEAIITEKEVLISKEKQLGEQKALQEKEIGKQEVINQILQSYNRPFDELIASSTLQMVERDLLIVGDKLPQGNKLPALQSYFIAEQVLHEKFNQHKVDNAVSLIAGIEQTDLVKKLNKNLNDYKLCNDALKKTIEKIVKIDEDFVANDDETQKDKLKEILTELSWYFRNYRFNFSDYPYLSEVVLEIMKLKQKDANTDIRYLLEKL